MRAQKPMEFGHQALPLPSCADPFQMTVMAETVGQLSCVLDSISRGVAGMESRVDAMEARIWSVEQQQAETLRQQAKLGSEMGSLDGDLQKLRREVSKPLEGLSLQLQEVATLRHVEDSISAVVRQHAELEKRQDLSNERAEKHAADLVKTREDLRQEVSEHLRETGQQLAVFGGEMDSCRRQLTEWRSFSERLPELLVTQSTLQGRLDDLVGKTQANLERHMTATQLQLRDYYADESKRVDSELGVLAESCHSRLAHACGSLTEDCRAELDAAIESMQGVLEIELQSSCRDLVFELESWHDNLGRLLDSWAIHLESMQFDVAQSPQMALQVADGLEEAAAMLSASLTRLQPSRRRVNSEPKFAAPQRHGAPGRGNAASAKRRPAPTEGRRR
mmetsp:Transcript_55357/g.124403  ORF Transcript_55357/g.124403 Transcript_55357/m.124403 type:complete len:392 (-) Transcript_55357:56-1231(-)